VSIRDLEHAIDTTRNDLNETLQALQARLSPTRRLKAAWGATHTGGAGAVRGGVAWAISHPVSVLAIGALVVLAVGSRPVTRRR
jgi:Protein of unknown function (DUF3618)